MKHLVLRATPYISITAAAVLGISGCNLFASEIDRAKENLNNELVHIVDESLPGEDLPIVYLIGENHAAVDNQIELRNQLAFLIDQKVVDTMLVEGNYGTYEMANAHKIFATQENLGIEADYWDTQLRWGLLSGYEHILLTYPDVKAIGIEDLVAKERYSIESRLHDSKNNVEVVNSYKIGLSYLESAVKDIKEKIATENLSPDQSQVFQSEIAASEALIQDFADSIGLYPSALERFSDYLAPWNEFRLEQASILMDQIEISESIEGGIDTYNRWITSRNNLVSRAQKLVKEYNTIVSVFQRLDNSGSTFNLSRLPMQSETAELLASVNVEKLTGLKNELERLEIEIRGYDRLINKYAPKFKSIEERFKKLSSKEKQIDAKNIESESDNVAETTRLIEDRYFEAANSVREIGDKTGIKFPNVEEFWAEHVKYLMARSNEHAVEQLKERDTAMAANVLSYLRKHGDTPVVAIVGAAHIEGIASEFRRLGIGFVAAKPLSVDKETEPWENKAWLERSSFQQSVFAENLKESTLLTNPRWQNEVVSRSKFFESLNSAESQFEPIKQGLVGEGKILALDDSSHRVVHITSIPFDRNASVGDHIVARGEIPGQPGKYFIVYDRRNARKAVEELSDENSVFVATHQVRSRNGRAEYAIVTPEKDMNFKEFIGYSQASSAGRNHKRVVLFREPDERLNQLTEESPFMTKLRNDIAIEAAPARPASQAGATPEKPREPEAAGAGNGGKPPTNNGTNLAAASPEPPGNRDNNKGRGNSKNNTGSGSASQSGGSGGGGNNNSGSGSASQSGGSGGGGPTGPGSSRSQRIPQPQAFVLPVAGYNAPKRPIYQTSNPKRAKENLKVLDKQKPADFKEVSFFQETGFDQAPFTPRSGTYGQTVIFHARNLPEFRQEVERAAMSGKLKNKQIALIICGDAYSETAILREKLLDAGALMVWVPDRQVSQEAGQKLYDFMKTTVNDTPAVERPATIDGLIQKSIEKWRKENPGDHDVEIFVQSSTWVELIPKSNSAEAVRPRSG